MRTREEMDIDREKKLSMSRTVEGGISMEMSAIIELLYDIRDLLSKDK